MGIITTPMYWNWRRQWNKHQNAVDREARLAERYTPRERREAQKVYDTDRAYRFTRDTMLDWIDAGKAPRGAGGRILDQLNGAGMKQALGTKRYNELKKLAEQTSALKVSAPLQPLLHVVFIVAVALVVCLPLAAQIKTWASETIAHVSYCTTYHADKIEHRRVCEPDRFVDTYSSK